MIFDEATLRKLAALTLIATRVRPGALKGDRRSTKRGSGLEFADYRNYVPGDDLRRLDWNAYARLDRPFIKLLEEEEDLSVHILLDASHSMDWGPEGANKHLYAVRLAAALGTIALSGGDRLTVSLLQGPEAGRQFGPARVRGYLMSLLAFLESSRPIGATDLSRSLRAYALAPRRPGLAVLISDLFSPGGYLQGITQLQSRGYELVLIHTLSPDEVSPPLIGDLRLVDVENGQAEEVSLDGGTLALYRRRLQAWRAEIRAECHRRDIRYLALTTDQAWERVALFEMRRLGIVK